MQGTRIRIKTCRSFQPFQFVSLSGKTLSICNRPGAFWLYSSCKVMSNVVCVWVKERCNPILVSVIRNNSVHRLMKEMQFAPSSENNSVILILHTIHLLKIIKVCYLCQSDRKKPIPGFERISFPWKLISLILSFIICRFVIFQWTKQILLVRQ